MKQFDSKIDKLDVVYSIYTNKNELKTNKTKKVAVVIFTNSKNAEPIVYDVTDSSNVEEAVTSMVSQLTFGSTYTYKLKAVVDNVYFYE